MGLNAQPSGERVHIGFFGLRNAGKSSVVNRVTGQTLSIVSDVKGTTTDPVQKAMELLKTNIRVADIAERVGYPNPNRFYINFRHYTSYTPSEYRTYVLKMI